MPPDLAGAGLAAQLPGDLGELGGAGGAERVTAGEQAAARRFTVLSPTRCPAKVSSSCLASSRWRSDRRAGSYSGRGRVPGGLPGGTPVITSIRCRSHQRALSTVSAGRRSNAGCGAIGTREPVTSSRLGSASSPAVGISVTTPVTSASRTVAPSNPATVRVSPPSRSVSPGRKTGCRVISSRTPSRSHRRGRIQHPGIQIGGQPATPQHGEQHRQHRQRIAYLGRPGPQRAPARRTPAPGRPSPQRGHTGDGGSPLASAGWPRGQRAARDPVIGPAGPPGHHGRRREHRGVRGTDPVIGPDVDQHAGAVGAADEEVRGVAPGLSDSLIQCSHIGWDATASTPGSASRAISTSRSTHDS